MKLIRNYRVVDSTCANAQAEPNVNKVKLRIKKKSQPRLDMFNAVATHQQPAKQNNLLFANMGTDISNINNCS